mgnify:CR=1 FL=1
MNLSKINLILILVLLIVIIGFGGYSYLYKSHEKIVNSVATYTGNSKEILFKVHKEPSFWLDKTVVIKDKISATDPNGITLNNTVYCQFNNPQEIKNLAQKQITIKGKIIGYDDLLEEVKLHQCIVLK